MKKAILLLILSLFHFICNSYKLTEDRCDWFHFDYDLRTIEINDDNYKIDEFFYHFHRSSHFNGNVLVAKGSEILFCGSYGYADYRKKEPLKIYSSFQVGSVSKQFTAYAIMMLNERGMLKYKDKVKQYFPDFPYDDITIWQLLTHRSGLSNYMYFCDSLSSREFPITNDSVLNILINKIPKPYFPPDKRFNYSNTGYVLLATLVEKISGIAFEDFMRDQVFLPLGMKHTFVYNMTRDEINNYPHLTKGYLYRWKKAKNMYLDGTTGDKNVYTTVEDLYKWSLALKTEKLLSNERLKEAFTPQNDGIKYGSNYGFGWRIRKIGEHKLVYHGGWWRGNNALFIKDTKTDYTIIVLSNVHNKLMSRIFTDLLPILGISEQINPPV